MQSRIDQQTHAFQFTHPNPIPLIDLLTSRSQPPTAVSAEFGVDSFSRFPVKARADRYTNIKLTHATDRPTHATAANDMSNEACKVT